MTKLKAVNCKLSTYKNNNNIERLIETFMKKKNKKIINHFHTLF